MSAASDALPGVLRYGYTHAGRTLSDADLIELIHLVSDADQRAMDEPPPPGAPADAQAGSLMRKALNDLVNVAVRRGIAWPDLAVHPLANRPWRLIGMIRDREARADAYRSEIHYHEQTAAALRTLRGRWLAETLDKPDAPTKIALAAELGVSRPTLDKWIDR